MDNTALLELAKAFADHTGRSLSTVSRLATGGGDNLRRVQAGGDITLRRANDLCRWLSDHWPADLDWPATVPRPEPTTVAKRREEVEVARRRALELGPDGHLAHPALFVKEYCGGNRDVLDYVLRTYANGSSLEVWPRKSLSADALEALIKSGDTRFQERRAQLLHIADLTGMDAMAARYSGEPA